MYIPRQQALSQSATLGPTVVVLPGSMTFALRAAIPSTEPEKNSTSTTKSSSSSSPTFNTQSIAFIAVVVTVLFFLICLVIYTFCRRGRYRGDDDGTESGSSTPSESAWRVDDPDSESTSISVAAKHRQRLKKLEQVAPTQSLGHWRAEKQETHVQNFATASTRLVCAICIDLIQDADKIRELHCGHVYHSNCLNLWVERGHHECPLCKYDILELGKQHPLKAHGVEDADADADAETAEENVATQRSRTTGDDDDARAEMAGEQHVPIQNGPDGLPETRPDANETPVTSHGANAEQGS